MRVKQSKDCYYLVSECFEMEYDRDKVDDAVLALLWLTSFDEDEYGARAWKSHDWDAMDRLYEKGFIANPRSKAKSVVLTETGLSRSGELFGKLFGVGNQRSEPGASGRPGPGARSG